MAVGAAEPVSGLGPFIGATSEIGALVTCIVRLLRERRPGGLRPPLVVACLCYAGMLASFFILNAPVNAATAAWTPVTLPPVWSEYRARWEGGHALAALLAVVGLAALLIDPRGRAFGVTRSR